MKHITLISEMGANLGHALRLHGIARVLTQRGRAVTLISSDPVAIESLRSQHEIDYEIVQGPACEGITTKRLSRVPATYSEILLANGFNRPDKLAQKIQLWHNTLKQRASDAFIFDFAPTAQLAAYPFATIKINIGAPFSVPPQHHPYPSFEHNKALSEHNRAASDQALQTVITRALARSGFNMERSLAELFAVKQTFLFSIPELDVYQRFRTQEIYLGPAPSSGRADCQWHSAGTKAFLYLDGRSPAVHKLEQALSEMNIEVNAFVPRRVSHQQPIRQPGWHVSLRPLKLEGQLDTCQFSIGHGGHGTALNSVLAGVPCLLIPQHQEQQVTARSCAAAGVGVTVYEHQSSEDYRDAIEDILANKSMKAAALRLKQRYSTKLPQSPALAVAQALESTL